MIAESLLNQHHQGGVWNEADKKLQERAVQAQGLHYNHYDMVHSFISRPRSSHQAGSNTA